MTTISSKSLSTTLGHKPSVIVVGYSGGVDSSALLHLCKNINTKVIAVYVNHHINADSDKWQEHCLSTCTEYGIEFISHSLDTKPIGENFEAWASKQRMLFFQSIMSKYNNPILLLGHHRDDQAETFLLNAIRGSGLAGLAGIPRYRELEFGCVIRPLLDYTKAEIHEYVLRKNITHIHDDSNDDNNYRRNLIRNELMPVLHTLNPSISKTLSRSADICSDSQSVLDKLLSRELSNILVGASIDIQKLNNLDTDIQKSVIHLWFKKNTKVILKNNQVQNIVKSLDLNKDSTGWIIDISQSLQVTIEYNLLVINNTAPDSYDIDNHYIITWLETKSGLNYNIQNLVIRERQSTDKCRYIGRDKNNNLKTLFQELKIPSRLRSQAKVITQNDNIIAVYPFFVCPINN